MDRYGRIGKGCVHGGMVMAAAALAGCVSLGGGSQGESFYGGPPSGEYVRDSGIEIQILGDGTEKAGTDEGRKEDQEQGPVPENDWQGNREGFDYGLVYPGEILEKEEVKLAGEDGFFTVDDISDWVFARMDGCSYREGCPVAREDLRYLRILHYDFSGNIRVGELVCHQSVSEDLIGIFRELYEAEYPIEKVVLIDDYGGDDDLSSSDNNTSCFNYRTVAGSDKLSLHGLGVAIDVNPLYNPYITWNDRGESRCAPSNGAAYMDRTMDFPYKIDEDDLCCRLFKEAGFTWGGNWEGNRDYMHFSRGYRPEG